MLLQNYWAILKLGFLKMPHTLRWMHTCVQPHISSAQINMHEQRHALIHMYDLPKRSGASGSDRLLLNRSITFSPNDNDIIRPFICGVIHVASNPLCSLSAIAFFWLIPTLFTNYSLLLNHGRKRGKWTKWKITKMHFLHSCYAKLLFVFVSKLK